MRSIMFKQGDLILDWVYDRDVVKEEVKARLGSTNPAYSRYVLVKQLDSNNNSSYEIVQADPDYGCDLTYLLSTPESDLSEDTINEIVRSSLAFDPRINVIDCAYVGGGQISLQYSFSNSVSNNEEDIITI